MRLAATTIATSELDPDSKIAVNVFGSAQVGSGSNVKPVDDLCPLTPVTQIGTLVDCLGWHSVRERGLGDGSDLEGALRHAQSVFGGAEPDRDHIVFLLTDGVIDLGGAPGASAVGTNVNDLSQTRIVQYVLPALRAAGVRVEVLPFGDPLYHPRLLGYADMQSDCAPTADAALPSAPGNGAVDVVDVVTRRLAVARCTQQGEASPLTRIPAGENSPPFVLRVPTWAETAAITVVGAGTTTDAKIDFFRPGSDDPIEASDSSKAGDSGGHAPWLTGAGSDVTTLHLDDPEPGDWAVQVSAPSTGAIGPVQVRSAWSGAPTMTFTIDPPRPYVHPDGQADTVDATVRVAAPEKTFGADLRAQQAPGTCGVVTAHASEGDLARMSVRIRAAGTGVVAGSAAGLEPLVGCVPDPERGDVAEFIGPVSAPGFPSDMVTYTAELVVDGNVVFSQPVLTSVGAQPNQDWATVSLAEGQAEPADRVGLSIDAWPSRTRTVELRLTQPSAEGLSLVGARVEQSNPDSAELVMAKNAPVGTVIRAVVEVHDAAYPEDLLGIQYLEVEVKAPGGGWGLLYVLLAVAGLLLLLAGLIVRRRRARRRQTPVPPVHPIEGLCLYLYRNNAEEGEPEHYLTVPPHSKELWFAIERDKSKLAWLRAGGSAEDNLGVLSGTADPGRVRFKSQGAEHPNEYPLGKTIWRGESMYVTVADERRDDPTVVAAALAAAGSRP